MNLRILPPVDCSTRRKRRATLNSLISILEQVVEGEIAYRDNMPDNLYGSDSYDAADNTVSSMEDALDALHSAYVWP